MLDPAIEAFFAERKEGWLKKNLKASMSEAEVHQIKQKYLHTVALFDALLLHS